MSAHGDGIDTSPGRVHETGKREHIDRAAEVIAELSGDCRARIVAIAEMLDEAGLLTPAPLREEWTAAWEGLGATRIGFAQDDPDDIEGIPPGGWVVHRFVSDWLPVDRAEGDGRAEQ